MLLFAVWLHGISDTFTMGYYTPIPKKIALSLVAILLPVILLYQRTRRTWMIIGLFVLLVWIPLILLWLLDRPGELLNFR